MPPLEIRINVEIGVSLLFLVGGWEIFDINAILKSVEVGVEICKQLDSNA